MSHLPVYSYYNASGNRRFVDSDDFVFTGTWSAITAYTADFSAVLYGNTRYMAIVTNTGIAPQTGTPSRWAPLVSLYDYQGTAAPANEDLVAQSIANAAYALAQIGTNTGTAAYTLAGSAWATADAAYSLAQTGTNAVAVAQSTANAAYLLAQIGTNTGTAAHNLASTKVSRSGDTMTGVLTTPNVHYSVSGSNAVTGTLAVDLNYSAYLAVSVTGNIHVVPSNTVPGAGATVYFVHDTVDRAVSTTDGIRFVGTHPTILAANKVSTMSLTSFGSTVNAVIGAFAQQQ